MKINISRDQGSGGLPAPCFKYFSAGKQKIGSKANNQKSLVLTVFKSLVTPERVTSVVVC